jgi:hypothetical protein
MAQPEKNTQQRTTTISNANAAATPELQPHKKCVGDVEGDSCAKGYAWLNFLISFPFYYLTNFIYIQNYQYN